MEKRQLYRFQKERRLSLLRLEFTIIVRTWWPSPDAWLTNFLQNENKNKKLARYWKDPGTFNPSRFLAADWPRDAFIPFSSGEKWESFFLGMTYFFHLKYMQEPVHVLVESIPFSPFKSQIKKILIIFSFL